ncbi:MAG: CCA tRNA nucleotidyltransferase [Anaplasma sp.]
MLSRLVSNHGVTRIIEALEGAMGNTRLVGGCVRDSILGRETTDIDLATDLVPDEVIAALQKVGIKTIPTGIKHGTVTAVVRGAPYEITTLRRDVKCDGRHADVAFTNCWTEDASRRDFTFNALYCDKHGKVFDYFSGIKDLERRTVAFIGDAEERINEDFLRILRVFRFHASICSENVLSSDIIDVCGKYANSISKLSKERVRSEFFKLLSCTNCVGTLQVMQECGVLHQIIPYKVCVDRLSSPHLINHTPVVKLAAMLKGEACIEMSAMAAELEKLLRLSRKEKKLLATLLTVNLPTPLSPTQQRKYLSDLGTEAYIGLILIEFLHGNTLSEDALLEHLTCAEQFLPSAFPISGRDLVALGYLEGKSLGHTLKKLREIWEKDPTSTTRDSLLLAAQRLLFTQRNTSSTSQE